MAYSTLPTLGSLAFPDDATLSTTEPTLSGIPVPGSQPVEGGPMPLEAGPAPIPSGVPIPGFQPPETVATPPAPAPAAKVQAPGLLSAPGYRKTMGYRQGMPPQRGIGNVSRGAMPPRAVKPPMQGYARTGGVLNPQQQALLNSLPTGSMRYR